MDTSKDDILSSETEYNMDIPVKLYDAWEQRFDENDKFEHETD